MGGVVDAGTVGASGTVTSWACGHPEHQRRRREALVLDGAVEVRAVSSKGERRSWTSRPVPLPTHVPSGPVQVLAVVPHEWSTDLIVQFCDEKTRHHAEVWRLSPVRFLAAPTPLSKVLGNEVTKIDDVTCDAQVSSTSADARRLRMTSRGELHEVSFDIDLSATSGYAAGNVTRSLRRFDLFVSYKSPQENIARMIANELSDAGVDVWFAPARHKARFAGQMRKLVRDTPYILILWSARSDEGWEQAKERRNDSEYKQAHEIVQAIAIEDGHVSDVVICALDDTPLHPELKMIQSHGFNRVDAQERLTQTGADVALSDEVFAAIIADYVHTELSSRKS